MTAVWEFIGWLLFGDHVALSVPSTAGLVYGGWWLRRRHEERRSRLSGQGWSVLCFVDGCKWAFVSSDLSAVEERARRHKRGHDVTGGRP